MQRKASDSMHTEVFPEPFFTGPLSGEEIQEDLPGRRLQVQKRLTNLTFWPDNFSSSSDFTDSVTD